MTIPTIQQQVEFAKTMDDMPSHLEALQALKEAAPLACAPLSEENGQQCL